MQSEKLDLTPIADRMRENPVVKKAVSLDDVKRN